MVAPFPSETTSGPTATALVPVADGGGGGGGVAGPQSQKSVKGTPKAPRRIVRSGIPDSILLNKDLQRVIAECLPPNYSFEVPKTVWRVQQAKAKTVALQFPEGLLMYATTLADILERFAGVEHCIILGDVAYGACCVDDIAAQMLGADLLVHYGHSCLVPLTNTLIPCLYVFVGIAIDAPHLIATVARNFSPRATRLVLAGTVQFSAALQQASSALRDDHGYTVVVPQSRPLSAGEVLGCTAPRIEDEPRKVPGRRASNSADSTSDPGRAGMGKDPEVGPAGAKDQGVGPTGARDQGAGPTGARSPEVGLTGSKDQEGGPTEAVADALVFVADGRFHLEAMMIANPSLPAYRYDPFTRTLLRERYDHRGMRGARRSAVEAAQGAREWGVVLGTLGRQGNLRTLSYILESLEERGRNATVFLVSELSPEKVRKVGPTVEAWVQIACPRLSIDWGEAFQVPVLTPFELSVALGKTDPWWAPIPLAPNAKGPIGPLRSQDSGAPGPEHGSSESQGCARCAGVTPEPSAAVCRESEPVADETCTAEITASGSRCADGAPTEPHMCHCGAKGDKGRADETGEGGAEDLELGEKRPYPMDYYAAAGGPWNSTYMPRLKSIVR